MARDGTHIHAFAKRAMRFTCGTALLLTVALHLAVALSSCGRSDKGQYQDPSGSRAKAAEPQSAAVAGIVTVPPRPTIRRHVLPISPVANIKFSDGLLPISEMVSPATEDWSRVPVIERPSGASQGHSPEGSEAAYDLKCFQDPWYIPMFLSPDGTRSVGWEFRAWPEGVDEVEVDGTVVMRREHRDPGIKWLVCHSMPDQKIAWEHRILIEHGLPVRHQLLITASSDLSVIAFATHSEIVGVCSTSGRVLARIPWKDTGFEDPSEVQRLRLSHDGGLVVASGAAGGVIPRLSVHQLRPGGSADTYDLECKGVPRFVYAEAVCARHDRQFVVAEITSYSRYLPSDGIVEKGTDMGEVESYTVVVDLERHTLPVALPMKDQRFSLGRDRFEVSGASFILVSPDGNIALCVDGGTWSSVSGNRNWTPAREVWILTGYGDDYSCKRLFSRRGFSYISNSTLEWNTESLVLTVGGSTHLKYLVLDCEFSRQRILDLSDTAAWSSIVCSDFNAYTGVAAFSALPEDRLLSWQPPEGESDLCAIMLDMRSLRPTAILRQLNPAPDHKFTRVLADRTGERALSISGKSGSAHVRPFPACSAGLWIAPSAKPGKTDGKRE